LTAKTYGLEDEASMLLATAGVQPPQLLKDPLLARCPIPILRNQENWPLESLPRQDSFKAAVIAKNDASPAIVTQKPLVLDDEEVGWGGDDLDGFEDAKSQPKSADILAMELEGIDDNGWGDTGISSPGVPVQKERNYVPPENGKPYSAGFYKSSIACDLISAGGYESAMELLNEQAGICNFAPLKSRFERVFTAANAFTPANGLCPPLVTPMLRSIDYEGNALPMNPFTLESLISKLQAVYPVMTAGRFSDAENEFRSILLDSIFTVTNSAAENKELDQLIVVCREYLVGLGTETARKKLAPTDTARSLELASYFTHCGIQNIHLTFAIRAAMIQAFKLKNFGNALLFAKRLISLDPPANFIELVDSYF
jgi:coatomer protein complex subunit alpha (xenin)